MQAYTLSRNTLLSKVFAGLFMSLLTALLGLYAGQFLPIALLRLLAIVELVMIVVAMFVQRRRHIGMAFVLTFTFISGMTLMPVIAHYVSLLGAQLVLQAVGVAAGAFLIAAVTASRTSMDFSFLGGFLFVGLMALLLMGLVSLFTGFSAVAQLIYSVLGIAVFVGYVLFDVNRMAHNGIAAEQVPWIVLSLYLDLVNLILFVLRLFGVLQSNRR